MGCDIHCYVEFKGKGDERWRPFGGRINPGRYYRLFGRLAGVRGGTALVPPRGYPDDAAYNADGDHWLFIHDAGGDNCVTPSRAIEYVGSYGSRYKLDSDGKAAWVSDPDWHSHTWLTPDEFAAALLPDAQPTYRALLAAMRSLEGEGYAVRIVIWFDN